MDPAFRDMRPRSQSRDESLRLSGETWGSLFCDEHNQANPSPADFPTPLKSLEEKPGAILR